MTALRVFPFIGALVAIAAVVLGIIGVSTTYWLSTGVLHAGKRNYNFNIETKNFILWLGLWQDCVASGCVKTDGGRSAAMALAVWKLFIIITFFIRFVFF